MHGTQDEILSDTCSHQIYTRAQEPKEIRLYPGCRHGLDECRDQVDQDLVNWLLEQLTK
jgi:alpha-beta hydrolase superfamily lysophospholipase